jgi:DNA-binding CsgD family transcriptional regulator
MRTNARGDEETTYGYPEDIAMPAEGGVRNEDLVGDERAAQVRGRYLAQTTDLTDEQAEALAWRELGYTAAAIARELDRAEGTVESWLARTAAQYCLCAIETKWPAIRGDLTPMTCEHLLECHPAVRLQYREVAERSPSVVPAEVMETVRELNEHGTRPSGPTS